MTHAWWLVFWVLYVALYLAISAFLIVAYLRSRRWGFVWLGVAVVIWPILDALSEALRVHFLGRIMAGERPWLFPYSLMVSGLGGMRGWEMSPGEFLTKFWVAKGLVGMALLLVAIISLARSFPRGGAGGAC